jgi:hypothetical protein
MIPNIDIPLNKILGRRFKVRKLQYNTYEIDHQRIKGQLRLLSIPVNIFEVPEELLSKGMKSELPSYVINYQSLVGFTNTGEKIQPKPMPTSTDIRMLEKKDITNFIVDHFDEPWNEFILQGNPPIMIRTKTVLAKLEWIHQYTDIFGDPSLWANHSTTHSVSEAPVGEGGMR